MTGKRKPASQSKKNNKTNGKRKPKTGGKRKPAAQAKKNRPRTGGGRKKTPKIQPAVIGRRDSILLPSGVGRFIPIRAPKNNLGLNPNIKF